MTTTPTLVKRLGPYHYAFGHMHKGLKALHAGHPSSEFRINYILHVDDISDTFGGLVVEALKADLPTDLSEPVPVILELTLSP